MNQNVFRSNCNIHEDSERTWSALDTDSRHPLKDSVTRQPD